MISRKGHKILGYLDHQGTTRWIFWLTVGLVWAIKRAVNPTVDCQGGGQRSLAADGQGQHYPKAVRVERGRSAELAEHQQRDRSCEAGRNSMRSSSAQISTVPGSQGVLVLCGSMRHYPAMLKLKDTLERLGFRAIVPQDEKRFEGIQVNEAEYLRFKKRVSERYFRIIRSRSVSGILVVNLPKDGNTNYIGANTFAEIAVAISAGKRVYLLDNVFEPYRDELLAWETVPLARDLNKLLPEMSAVQIDEEQRSLAL